MLTDRKKIQKLQYSSLFPLILLFIAGLGKIIFFLAIISKWQNTTFQSSIISTLVLTFVTIIYKTFKLGPNILYYYRVKKLADNKLFLSEKITTNASKFPKMLFLFYSGILGVEIYTLIHTMSHSHNFLLLGPEVLGLASTPALFIATSFMWFFTNRTLELRLLVKMTKKKITKKSK